MSKIVVAFDGGSNRRRISDMLESSGMPVKSVCRSGAEVIRRVHEFGGGIVVCGYKLADMTATDLAYDLDGKAFILIIVPPEHEGDCKGENVFRLPAPATKADIVASVRMLEQMEDMAARKNSAQRVADEKQVVEKAKVLLMQKSGLSEPDASRFIQHRSTEFGMKLSDAARKILIENLS